MSAISETKRHSPLTLIALAIVLWICAVNATSDLVGGRLPISTPNDHAVQAHGGDAWIAINWLEAHPQTRKRIPCNGRPVWFDTLPDGRVATVVTVGDVWETARNVTAMLLDPKHFERFVRKCGGAPPVALSPIRATQEERP